MHLFHKFDFLFCEHPGKIAILALNTFWIEIEQKLEKGESFLIKFLIKLSLLFFLPCQVINIYVFFLARVINIVTTSCYVTLLIVNWITTVNLNA